MGIFSRKPVQPVYDHIVRIENDSFVHVNAGIYNGEAPNTFKAMAGSLFPHTLTPPGQFQMHFTDGTRIVFKDNRLYIKNGETLGRIYNGYPIEGVSYFGAAKYTLLVTVWDGGDKIEYPYDL